MRLNTRNLAKCHSQQDKPPSLSLQGYGSQETPGKIPVSLPSKCNRWNCTLSTVFSLVVKNINWRLSVSVFAVSHAKHARDPRGAFDWEIRILDFTIKHEIRFRISTERNPFSRRILSNNGKSNPDFPIESTLNVGMNVLFMGDRSLCSSAFDVVTIVQIQRTKQRKLGNNSSTEIAFVVKKNPEVGMVDFKPKFPFHGTFKVDVEVRYR